MAWKQKVGTKVRWRASLDTWMAKQSGKKLTEQQEALAEALQRLLDQLADAASLPRGHPFLVITDKLSGQTRAMLTRFIKDNSLDVLLVHIDETKILEKTKQMRAALHLPENLSGGAP